MILAGDVGGTKTILGLFKRAGAELRVAREETFPSQEYPSLEAIIGEFLGKRRPKIETLAVGVAGPVVEGRSEVVNLRWPVDRRRLARELSIDLYNRGAAFAAERGILIADTKFEFGILDGELILIDEVMTPDSSRFWPADIYEPGHDQPSFDKQIVRNYLLDIKWEQKPPAPKLPQEVIDKTSKAYRDVYKRLAGKELTL